MGSPASAAPRRGQILAAPIAAVERRQLFRKGRLHLGEECLRVERGGHHVRRRRQDRDRAGHPDVGEPQHGVAFGQRLPGSLQAGECWRHLYPLSELVGEVFGGGERQRLIAGQLAGHVVAPGRTGGGGTQLLLDGNGLGKRSRRLAEPSQREVGLAQVLLDAADVDELPCLP